jgi:hypothetical protein
MRTLVVWICLLGFLTAPLEARNEKKSPFNLTVILYFKGTHSRATLAAMERETELILGSSGVRVRWAMLGEEPPAVENDLVVMRFNGSCEFDPSPQASGKPGPLAFAWSSGGEILPFGEVNCDRIVKSARGAMSSGDYARANQLVGRAMGRVLAHELLHILTGSPHHSTMGISQPALSGRQLIEEVLPLSDADGQG